MSDELRLSILPFTTLHYTSLQETGMKTWIVILNKAHGPNHYLVKAHRMTRRSTHDRGEELVFFDKNNKELAWFSMRDVAGYA